MYLGCLKCNRVTSRVRDKQPATGILTRQRHFTYIILFNHHHTGQPFIWQLIILPCDMFLSAIRFLNVTCMFLSSPQLDHQLFAARSGTFLVDDSPVTRAVPHPTDVQSHVLIEILGCAFATLPVKYSIRFISKLS